MLSIYAQYCPYYQYMANIAKIINIWLILSILSIYGQYCQYCQCMVNIVAGDWSHRRTGWQEGGTPVSQCGKQTTIINLKLV